MTRRRKIRSRALGILLGMILPLILLEVGLQVASLVVAFRHRSNEVVPDSGGRTVLCLGDSNTFGICASSPEFSYPSQLEGLLDPEPVEGGPPAARWRVVNRGWPGQNTSLVLQRAPDQLAANAPDYVCILAGVNNSWNVDGTSPGPVEASVEAPGTWKFRFRTLRLLRLIQASLSGAGDPPTSRPADASPEPPDPRSETRSGPAPGPGAADASRKRGPPDPLMKPLREVQGWPFARRLEQAKDRLDELRGAVRAEAGPQAAELYLMLLQREKLQEAAELDARFFLDKFGPSVRACGTLAWSLCRKGQPGEALVFADQAVELQQGKGQEWVHLTRARIHDRLHDSVRAFRDRVLAFDVSGDRTALARLLRPVAAVDPARLENLLVGLRNIDVSEDVRREVREVCRELRQQMEVGGGPLARIEGDLGLLVELVRRAGSEPILLTYPRKEHEEISDCIRSVADQHRVPLVDIGRVFERLLRGVAEDPYVSWDGAHPNDEGYRVMAEQVAERIRSLEQAIKSEVR